MSHNRDPGRPVESSGETAAHAHDARLTGAYVLARTLHEVFTGRAMLLSQEEIEQLGIVHQKPSHGTERVNIFTRSISQSLSMGREALYLSTTDRRSGGKVVRHVIKPTVKSEKAEEAHEDALEALEK